MLVACSLSALTRSRFALSSTRYLNFCQMKKLAIASVFTLAVMGCGDKSPPTPLVDCETESIKAALLTEFAAKLKEEGAKGHTSASMKELLSIKDVAPLEKATKSGYSKCAAKIAISYPQSLSEQIAKSFASEKSYEAFKESLEDRYGIVNGAGIHAQLMDAIADGPFGTVPITPDPANVAKYQKTIQKNLDALMAEQLDIAISYELTTGTDPNGKPSEKLKWQINKRDALDINVVLISIGTLQ